MRPNYFWRFRSDVTKLPSGAIESRLEKGALHMSTNKKKYPELKNNSALRRLEDSQKNIELCPEL